MKGGGRVGVYVRKFLFLKETLFYKERRTTGTDFLDAVWDFTGGRGEEVKNGLETWSFTFLFAFL